MFANRFFKLSAYYMVVMIAGILISQEIFAIDILTALKPLWNTIASMLCDCYDF